MEHFQSRAPALKLIVAYKMVKGLFMLGLGLVLLHEQLLGRVESFAWHAADWFRHREWVDGLGQTIAAWIHHEITNSHVEFAIALILGDSLSTTVEGLGLHYRQRWAAWWVVLATGALIPFELVELVRRVTLVRAGILAINVAIVLYLVRRVLIEQRPHHPAPV